MRGDLVVRRSPFHEQVTDERKPSRIQQQVVDLAIEQCLCLSIHAASFIGSSSATPSARGRGRTNAAETPAAISRTANWTTSAIRYP
jgi:hypothetical protein